MYFLCKINRQQQNIPTIKAIRLCRLTQTMLKHFKNFEHDPFTNEFMVLVSEFFVELVVFIVQLLFKQTPYKCLEGAGPSRYRANLPYFAIN